MAVLLGLASAIVYGAGDFLGALATRRSGEYAVVVWSQLVGLGLLASAIVVMGDQVPPRADLLWGAAGGIGGGTGVVLLYRGLAIGRMSIVSPTAGVVAAVIPVMVGLLLGDRPALLSMAGVIVALVAIVLVSSADHGDERTSARRTPDGLLEGIGAGLGFALFFTCLAQTSGSSDLWPLVLARVSIGVAAIAGVTVRASLRPAPGSLPLIALVGLLDMGANLLYILSTRHGLLSIVAVLVSLYPASTVVLARIVLGERLTRVQLGGLAAAAVGVALIAV